MRNLTRIVEKVYNQPWLIKPSYHENIIRILETHIQETPMEDDFEEPELPEPDFINGVAVIPIYGIIGKHLSLMEQMCGGMDINWLTEELKKKRDDTNCTSIVLYFNSPGGTVIGVPELGDLIAEIATIKPIVAYTDADMCSGAYWLASQCTSIFSTKSATIGSIGVYSIYIDKTRRLENEGVKINAISAGKYKLTGASFRVLSDEEKAILQAGVDKIYVEFLNAVSKRKIPNEYCQGQVFDGMEALQYGLTDGLVTDIDEVITSLQADNTSK